MNLYRCSDHRLNGRLRRRDIGIFPMPTKMLVDVGLFVRFIILALMAVEENINDIDVKYIVDIAKMNSDLLILNGAMNVLILQCCVFFFFYFFFLCLCTRESVEIMLQFQTMGVVSCIKMNLVGALRRSFFEFPNSFQKRREKPKKN
ncbi:Uncharacterized protein FWK35_00036229 [Aphis craccivora]|uniref:Uncharacterized protein n=2 Tax=Aphis craccivora TaxID=307492 RepID=A0A6G0YQ25_APHCR|nr:Uncharacterized protein FWK35_00036229 [Aphis craccivora]